MKKRNTFIIACVIFAAAALTLTGCVPGDGSNTIFNPAGFFTGIWHGWIAPVSLIMSIFNGKYSIYEVHNSGFWYNLGYYAAIISGFGGLSLARKKVHKD